MEPSIMGMVLILPFQHAHGTHPAENYVALDNRRRRPEQLEETPSTCPALTMYSYKKYSTITLISRMFCFTCITYRHLTDDSPNAKCLN